MEYILFTLAVILMIAGIIGCLLPAVPGPPFSWAGLVLAHLSGFAHFEIATLIILGIITIIVALLDYVVPAWGTKKFGGTKYGTRGSIVGLIIGIFFLPIGPAGLTGIIGGPFAGAYIGELIGGRNSQEALRAAWGSFIGFLAGTVMKLALAVTMCVMLALALG